jgi:hypothetical protein
MRIRRHHTEIENGEVGFFRPMKTECAPREIRTAAVTVFARDMQVMEKG